MLSLIFFLGYVLVVKIYYLILCVCVWYFCLKDILDYKKYIKDVCYLEI